MKLKFKVLAGAAGAIFIGWLIFGHVGGNGRAADQAKAPPVSITAAEVKSGDIPLYVVGIGTIQAFNTVTMHARVDGELMNVAFHEGQDVKKGDVLAQIDPRPYQAALDNALATLAKDEAMHGNAKRDLERYEDTAAKGYSSRQQLDTQTTAVTSAGATIQADKALAESARVQLGYTTITSPLDGVTGIRLIDQGNIVHANDMAGLVVITQIQPISAIFTLPQDVLPRVVAGRANGPLTVTALDSDSAVELGQGTLELIDNQIDQATGTIRLKAKFSNEQRTLWPGQFVNIRLQLGIARNVLSVATRVIQRGPNGLFAYVVKPDNSVDTRPVETGQSYGGYTLVTKGLSAGERVVVDGQLRLQPGSRVKAIDDKTASAGNIEVSGAEAATR